MGADFENLLRPLAMGDVELKNRVVMASLTRNRDSVPRENLHVPYYAERSGTGLIVRTMEIPIFDAADC
jgi:2,4-dienoyl-CoA reductase-like NADH-dependent reductase (Old Yellow Enzyme family)